MRRHVSDQDLMASLDADPSGQVRDHLAGCATCRADRERLRAALAGLVGQMREQAARPEADWDRQVRQIVARLRGEPRAHTGRWWWAVVPALVGLAAFAGIWIHQGQDSRVATSVESDETFLTAVERSLQADVPAALRPVALLLGEVEDVNDQHGRDG